MALDVGGCSGGDVDGVGERGVVGNIVGKGVELDPAPEPGDDGEEGVAGPGGGGGEGGVDRADVVGSSCHGSPHNHSTGPPLNNHSPSPDPIAPHVPVTPSLSHRPYPPPWPAHLSVQPRPTPKPASPAQSPLCKLMSTPHSKIRAKKRIKREIRMTYLHTKVQPRADSKVDNTTNYSVVGVREIQFLTSRVSIVDPRGRRMLAYGVEKSNSNTQPALCQDVEES